jgi:hypothetical protein
MTIHMRIVDFADEMLQGSINEKIKDCRESIHKLQQFQGQLQHLVRKDTKVLD